MANLFPILNNESPALTGIARLAAQSHPLGDGHFVEYKALPVKSVINRVVSRRQLPFSLSINPYRGCEFACRYCYARYTHEFMELRQPEDFERQIFVKQNTGWLLEQELRRHDPSEPIAIGTATDPYQPIERTARMTQGILEVFAKRSGLRLGLITKSTLIERDIPLLQQIADRNHLSIHVTITTTNTQLARTLEPRAPRPDLRFRTVRRLRDAGLNVGIFCSPVLPAITDTPRALERMVRAAADSHVTSFHAQPLFLKPSSKPVFDAFIAKEFPGLVHAYQARYADGAFVTSEYRKNLARLVKALCTRHGIAEHEEESRYRKPVPSAPLQGNLFPGSQQVR
jgi:DNA repair photolyase